MQLPSLPRAPSAGAVLVPAGEATERGVSAQAGEGLSGRKQA